MGGGPSLRGQIEIVAQAIAEGTPAVGANFTAAFLRTHFGVIFDFDWFRKNPGFLWRFPGIVFVPENRLRGTSHYNIAPVKLRPGGRRSSEIGLSDSFSDGLYSNRCGGGLAISVAWALGADPILLVGYDSDGNRHWYETEQAAHMDGQAHTRNMLDALAVHTGRRVINCSAETALTGFPRGELERELAWIKQS